MWYLLYIDLCTLYYILHMVPTTVVIPTGSTLTQVGVAPNTQDSWYVVAEIYNLATAHAHGAQRVQL